jgi:MFS transporter, PAT family, beta-lactamase induction signal transducer AmpG
MPHSLLHAVKIFFSKNMMFLLLLGFSSGLPFLLILSSLSFWLAELGYSESFVGLFTIVSLPYSLKFLWAPLVEQVKIPYVTRKMGQKRSYGLLSQCLLMIFIIIMGCFSPEQNPAITALVAVIICFFSATQDIVMDGLRIDLLNQEKSGAGAAMESIGFHLGKLASGVGVLYLANHYSWQTAYKIMALGILPGLFALINIKPDYTKIIRIPKRTSFLKSMKLRYQLPFLRLQQNAPIVMVIVFIVLFKFPDAMLNATQPSFLYSLGLDKIEFANITKFYGTTLMIFGAIAAGLMVDLIGLMASGILCGALMGVSCILFSIQAIVGYDDTILMMTIGVESFASGMSNSVFIAILSSFCFRPYNASHFTILYSIGSLSRVVISALSGVCAQRLSWQMLYLLSAFVSIPMVFFLKKSYHRQVQMTKLRNENERKTTR